jgi:hypothetical protein
MQFLGESGGVRWYWAEPGRFVTPGVYYWDGTNNVHVAAPQASQGALQGGQSNNELRAALRAKLPNGAYPEDEWLTPFALGVEVGAALAASPLPAPQEPALKCIECDGPVEWRCPACKIRSPLYVAPAPVSPEIAQLGESGSMSAVAPRGADNSAASESL